MFKNKKSKIKITELLNTRVVFKWLRSHYWSSYLKNFATALKQFLKALHLHDTQNVSAEKPSSLFFHSQIYIFAFHKSNTRKICPLQRKQNQSLFNLTVFLDILTIVIFSLRYCSGLDYDTGFLTVFYHASFEGKR